ncbi:MAG TPA: hypothetical protein PLL76_06320 [Thermoanaerobaculia bacterium]|nr:hypothetical protein [Thermoanaerobaculia bacterium]
MRSISNVCVEICPASVIRRRRNPKTPRRTRTDDQFRAWKRFSATKPPSGKSKAWKPRRCAS